MKVPLKGIIVALSAASLFACGGTEEPPGSKTQEIKCAGINDCKGHSDCAGATNDCKGLNDCKGQGYLLVASETECKDKGGTVL